MRRLLLIVILGLGASARADEGTVGEPAPAPVPAPAPAPVTPPPYPGTSIPAPPGYQIGPPPMLAARPEPPRHAVSLTISPAHFILPMVEVTGELRLMRKLGVAGILGAGRIKSGGETFGAYEAGAQLVYYLLGSFDGGIEAGAEALYMKVGSTSLSSTTVSGQATGSALGPFLGYKWVGASGFTFVGQLGVDFLAAHASNGAGGKRVFPLLNLQVGWSF